MEKFRGSDTVPPSITSTDRGELDLWWFDLDTIHPSTCLSEEELGRLARLAGTIERHRFLAAHVCTRTIIASLLGTRPQDVRFARGPQGKPELPGAALEFSLTHSESVGGLAAKWNGAVGLDAEYYCAIPDLDDLARCVCAPSEYEIFTATPEVERQRLFLRIWTRKEAVLKATGLGLSCPPQRVVAMTNPTLAEAIAVVPGHGDWWVTDVAHNPALVAACSAKTPCVIRVWQASDDASVSTLITTTN